MATINFYLKEPNCPRKTLIYVKYNSENLKVKLSTGQKIHPDKWNQNTKKARKTYDGFSDLNGFLASAEAELERIQRDNLALKNKLTPEIFKKEFYKFLGKEKIEKQVSVIDLIDEFLEVKKGKLSFNYLRSMNTLRNHLKEFVECEKYKLNFETINLLFYEKFTSYLLGIGQCDNTIGTNISKLKYFLNWATEMGYNSTLNFKDKKFKATEKTTEEIALTEEELYRLYNLDLSQNLRLSKVRDFFCFGCFTGLRYSDLENLKPEDIKGEKLHITVLKTRQELEIPLSQDAREILERNNFNLPSISNQKTNLYLKELGELAGIDDTIKRVTYQGSERVETLFKKYELIGTHTGRRTFVTLSLEKGMRPEVIMKITGHKSIKYFMRYVKITAKIMEMEIKKGWDRPQESLLKVI